MVVKGNWVPEGSEILWCWRGVEQVGFLPRLQEMSSLSGLIGSVDSTIVVA